MAIRGGHNKPIELWLSERGRKNPTELWVPQNTYLNSGRVVQADLEANGAVIHLIDVLMDVPEGTIYAVTRNAEYPLSTFANYIDRVHLNTTLDRIGKNCMQS